MKYLLVALLNGIYGIITLEMLTRNTPGYYFILVIALVLTIAGLVGFILYIRLMISSAGGKQSDSTLIKGWFSFTKNIDFVLITGLLFRAFVLQPYIVDGNSMEQNFHNNEYILVDQITYRFRAPAHGETIVFHPPTYPNESYIKRIIGLPGETVIITNNTVAVNGHILDESYISPDAQTIVKVPVYQTTLKDNQYFVMGDNREHSSDSREWGTVSRKSIVGRAWLVVYPAKDFGLVKNPLINLASLPNLTISPTISPSAIFSPF